MNVLDVVPSDQATRSSEEFKKLRNRGAYEKFTGKMRRKDGSHANIEVSSSLIRAGGEVVGSRDIVRDITDRLRSEENLLRAQKLESLGVLAGGIAHDFRNLLMAIMGNVDLALMSLTPQGQARIHLEKAEKAILRAKGLTDQLLTLS